jgi:Holliday junction resolvase RusA-like endonuclease
MRPRVALDGPLLLGVRAYMPIPKSKSGKFKAAAMAGDIRPTGRPDLDNLLKQIKDCFTRMQIWVDDKLVVGYLPGTGKYYDDGQGARWEITIQTGGQTCQH